MGARVRRSIGRPELRSFDPFLMLDEFSGDTSGGFPDHPHRGFETVTYLLEGAFTHEDFLGHKGRLEAGDLQWMTAGRGIVHSEMPASSFARGLQLWVNLRSSDKMCEPAYQELKRDQVPRVTRDGVTAVIIAGTALGTTSPVYTRTPTHYLHFEMEPNRVLEQPIPARWNSFLYTLSGEITINGSTTIGAHHTVSLTQGGDGVRIMSSVSGPASFVLISGEPLGEPVSQHGPFVMNTKAEIQQAFADYQMGRNGFEAANGWESDNGQRLTRHR